mmetsp:Transcript_18518/g.34062  ORF Transcript_18518/g.34062 Transcript_18518/m.34062 type:complete len:284 (-) Transcript_18518:119-970(-)
MPLIIRDAVDGNGRNDRQVLKNAAKNRGADRGMATNASKKDDEEKSRDMNMAKRNKSEHTGTIDVIKRDHQQHRSNQKSTKIKLDNTANSWKSLLRDVIMAFIPLFVIYKISTHKLVSNIGYQDPNAPKKYSQQEFLEQLLFSLSLKKQQEYLQEEHLFLEAMNERKCYDFPTIDMSTKLKQQTKVPRRKLKGKNNPRRQVNKRVKVGKMNRPRSRRPPASSPSAPPWSSLIASAFWGNPPTIAQVNKGAEAAKHNSNVGNSQGGKRRPKKKKFGSRARTLPK